MPAKTRIGLKDVQAVRGGAPVKTGVRAGDVITEKLGGDPHR
jgi:hypothetical protein